MTTRPTSPSEPDLDVIIVGTGFSGLCMAIQLKKAGKHSFVILEKAEGVGGTWRENHYPGCACDVPSHLYSYSFEPNPHWSRMFAPQQEILAYLERCADKYGLGPHLRLGTEVVEARFDEAGALWRVETCDGAVLTARHLVLGVGALHRPAIPDIEGIDTFEGRRFHSARWDHEYDMTGKRIAVVGTGASAIQLTPHVAERAERLYLFQRTPPWVMHKPDRTIAPAERRLLARAPLLQRLYRYLIYWWMEARGFGFTVGPWVMKIARWMGKRHIRRQLRDPALRAAVTPTYTPGCKRILMADDYYPTLERPNVEVVTQAIARITERGVVTGDGVERPVDALVFATGFEVTDFLTPMRIFGRRGQEITDTWRSGIEAYLGTMVTGFPNLYLLMGPNTGLGHNSMVFMIEAQVGYVMRYMRLLERRGAEFADVRPVAQDVYNARLQPRLERSVWASGCQSWYLDEHGKNSTLWPGFTFEFWLKTLRVRRADYELVYRRDSWRFTAPRETAPRHETAPAGHRSAHAAPAQVPSQRARARPVALARAAPSSCRSPD